MLPHSLIWLRISALALVSAWLAGWVFFIVAVIWSEGKLPPGGALAQVAAVLLSLTAIFVSIRQESVGGGTLLILGAAMTLLCFYFFHGQRESLFSLLAMPPLLAGGLLLLHWRLMNP